MDGCHCPGNEDNQTKNWRNEKQTGSQETVRRQHNRPPTPDTWTEAYLAINGL